MSAVSGMVPVMMSPSLAAPVAERAGVGLTWHLATCNRCTGGLYGQPFTSKMARDIWTVRHIEATGHAVVLSHEIHHPDEEPVRSPRSCILRFYDAAWCWICTTCPGPVTPVEGHESGQLALADFDAHDCGALG